MNVIKRSGSSSRVRRVFWYDPNGYAGVQWDDGFCGEASVSELECLTPDLDAFADLAAELRKRASVVCPELVR